MMRIGELAERTTVSVRSLRYYEQRGLLASSRSSSGQRHYADTAIERVLLIQRLFAAGLSSRTIAALLPFVDAQISTPESRAELAVQRDHLSARIEELALARDRLDEVITATSAPSATCRYAPDMAPAAGSLDLS